MRPAGSGPFSINVPITAVRKLAVEAADNGLLAPELAAGITHVKGAKSIGVRVGNWLSVQQAQKLLNAPDVSHKTPRFSRSSRSRSHSRKVRYCLSAVACIITCRPIGN